MQIYRSDVEIKNSEFIGNICIETQFSGQGGAIYSQFSNLFLDSVIISENTGGETGAIYSLLSNVRINKSLISSNNGTKGSAIYAYGSKIEVLSSTIANNVADDGGAIYSQHNDLLAVNSIFWNDSDNEVYFRQDDDTSNFAFAFCDFRNLANGVLLADETEVNFANNNLNEQPLFVDAGNGNYNLDDFSPLIDKGTAFFSFNGSSSSKTRQNSLQPIDMQWFTDYFLFKKSFLQLIQLYVQFLQDFHLRRK